MPYYYDHQRPLSSQTSLEPPENEDPLLELIQIEAEVAKLSATLNALTLRSHALKVRANEIHSPFIRLLPPEIITEIFQFLIPPFTDSESDTAVPLRLGSVCSFWRTVAWANPSLWSSLSIRLNDPTINTQITLLRQWLCRSGDLPLSIRLVSEDEIQWGARFTPATAIQIVNEYSARWRNLDLRLPTSCYKYLPPSDASLPLLTSLTLNPMGGQGERRHKLDMSTSARIHNLTLSCVYLVSVKFQWDQVMHLYLQAFYVDECLEVLRQTPQLVSCALVNIIGGDDGHALPNSPVLLSSLKTLIIENKKDTNISLLLDTISMPNATHLSYSGKNLIHLPYICGLISRSTSLQTFSLLETVVSNEIIFIHLLRALKSVTKFVFTVPCTHAGPTPFGDTILRLCNPTLSPTYGNDCLLPVLRELEYSGPQGFTWSTFLETLVCRQSLWDEDDAFQTHPGAISDWRCVQISLAKGDKQGPDESVLARLLSLRANGMKVGLKVVSTDQTRILL